MSSSRNISFINWFNINLSIQLLLTQSNFKFAKKVIWLEKQIIKGFIVYNKAKLLWFCISLHRQICGVCVLYVVEAVQYIYFKWRHEITLSSMITPRMIIITISNSNNNNKRIMTVEWHCTALERHGGSTRTIIITINIIILLLATCFILYCRKWRGIPDQFMSISL